MRRVNHFSKKGCYLSQLEDYLKELEEKRRVRLGNRDKQLLNLLIYKPDYLSNLNRQVNELYEGIQLDKNTKKRIDAKHAIHYSITGPIKEQTTSKAIARLRMYKLIRPINKSLEDKGLPETADERKLTSEIMAINKNRAKLYDITEYGLFCFLSQAYMLDFDSSMLGRRWESKTIKLLLSPYFEKETFAGSLTTWEFSMMNDFLQGALHIINQRLSMTEESKKIDTLSEEQIAKLEDDLEWYAKSFALRLMADTASNDKGKAKNSHNRLNFLLHDRKFLKFAEDTMHGILSYYRGGKLLEYDKTLHP